MKRHSPWRRNERLDGARAQPASRQLPKPTIAALRLSPALIGILLMSACAGPERTFRDAHDVVTEVIDLTVDTQSASDAQDLFALEERVEAACRPIFKTANRRWIFGNAPFYAHMGTLVATHHCRRTVDEARRTLDSYRLRRGPGPAAISRPDTSSSLN